MILRAHQRMIRLGVVVPMSVLTSETTVLLIVDVSPLVDTESAYFGSYFHLIRDNLPICEGFDKIYSLPY